VKLRFLRRWGAGRIAGRLGLAASTVHASTVHASTVHAVLARYRVPRLAHLDRATGVRVRRYEHDRPDELVHVDVKKLGRIPDGGGYRVSTGAPANAMGRAQAYVPAAADDTRQSGSWLRAAP